MSAEHDRSVIVLWYSSGSWLGRLIRWVTRSHYSHVGIWVPTGSGPGPSGVLYEALGQGIRKLEGDLALERWDEAVAMRSLSMSATDRERVQAYLERQVGNGYSILGFVAAGLDAMTGWRLVITFGDRWICSAYVAAALVRGGLEPPQDPRLMDPEDMARWLEPEEHRRDREGS